MYSVKQIEVGETYFTAETKEECQSWIAETLRTTQEPNPDPELFFIEKVPEVFYVSLVGDLIGAYLRVIAKEKSEVRQYLEDEYHYHGTWRLPWCGVYDEAEFQKMRHVVGPVLMPHIVRLG